MWCHNPSSQEAEVGRSEVQGHLLLCLWWVRDHTGYLRPSLKKEGRKAQWNLSTPEAGASPMHRACSTRAKATKRNLVSKRKKGEGGKSQRVLCFTHQVPEASAGQSCNGVARELGWGEVD